MFLLGRQAMFGHDPPTYLRSIAATRCPCLAKVQAAIVDPVPPPRITRSYSSGSVFLDNCAGEMFAKFAKGARQSDEKRALSQGMMNTASTTSSILMAPVTD